MTRKKNGEATAAATSRPTARRLAPDQEMVSITRIFRELALLPPAGRQRVLAYVMARADTLPVIAAVGGGTDDAPLLPLVDRDRSTTDAAP